MTRYASNCERLADTEAACATLLANGGADYDGEEVRPRPILPVLLGANERASI
jgi:hypothetical protein